MPIAALKMHSIDIFKIKSRIIINIMNFFVGGSKLLYVTKIVSKNNNV